MDSCDDISALRNGAHSAFEHLFRKYYVLLCYEARSYVSDKQLIEELVGDVFRWLWENRETLDISTSIRAYLVKATHHACLSHLRKNRPLFVELEDAEERSTLHSLDESPLDYLLSKELIERINTAVQELPPQYRRVFELSRYQQLTYLEIAQEMGISINAVKLYQKKALAQLWQVLNAYLAEDNQFS